MKRKEFKRCPRCDKKTPIFQDRCENCGLIFSRLSKASNTAAKKAFKKKEYNKVILDKVLPRDLKKWPLFCYALFLGIFGAHYAKVGRYRMFTYFMISIAMLYIASFLPISWLDHEYLFLVMMALILPGSVSAIIWVVSIFQILFNKFKVPIAIDEEYVKESLDQELVEDILKNVKKEEEIKNNKELENKIEKPKKTKKIKVVCASCGMFVKVNEDETICPKCDEPLKED